MFEYIFTIGCFDKFHKGHIKLLENMKIRGEKIIVGLHDNSSINKLKNVRFQKTRTPSINKNYDFMILATEYPMFLKIPYQNFKKLKDKVVFDGRNILNKDKLKKNGIEYIGIGK